MYGPGIPHGGTEGSLIVRKELVLVTGGGRAGKSDFAQDIALSHGCDSGVLFVATAEVTEVEMGSASAGTGYPGPPDSIPWRSQSQWPGPSPAPWPTAVANP